ncbi:F-box only protein 5 [Heptranchias perlo]|uniref:F-box only protein 5 n=1 Tax=Heptranchias perlo TaxID=212740 RepID=UPI00355A4D3A
MRYSSRPSHLGACPNSTSSSRCSDGNEIAEMCSKKAGSPQRDSVCLHQARSLKSPESNAGARIAESFAVPAKCDSRSKSAGCSCGPSGCNPASSQDSGYLSQDSGYLSSLNGSSLSNSPEGQPCDEEEAKVGPAGVLHVHSVAGGSGLETKSAEPLEKSLRHPKWHLLPALQVGRAVCQRMGQAKGRVGVDQSMLREILPEQSFNIGNLIGRKMGLEHVDVWKELLERGFPHLLIKLLNYLSGSDLRNCVKVSKTWRRIILQDKWASQVLKKASRLRRMSAAHSLGDAATRRYMVSRGALSAVQSVGLNSPQKVSSQPHSFSLAKGSNSSQKSVRHQQVVKTLKWDETLKICPQCGSPAKFLSYQQRAICSSEHCAYDYCSQCFGVFHGSKDCALRLFKNSSKLQPQAGSRKSKRNLQRL